MPTLCPQTQMLPSVDDETSKARMKLVMATKRVLVRTLGLMGMSAPEQM